MDLSQTKLKKNEWDALEVPIIGREFDIISLIYKGGDDINESIKNTKSLIEFIKINTNIEGFHIYLFEKYFKPICNKIQKKNSHFQYNFKDNEKKGKKELKKCSLIRLNNFNKKIKQHKEILFEFIILSVLRNLIKKEEKYKYVYVLNYVLNLKVLHFNTFVLEYAQYTLKYFSSKISKSEYVNNYSAILKTLRKYEIFNSIKLFEHQKNIITTCKKKGPKLIMYQAPTGTGKTLTPLGLVKNNKIIFVCAAKHIGLQLAKSCISLEIPIAIAFGCKDPSDIRLHYFAAKETVRNTRTGGIWRVDNSVGDNVEIIISDIQSYLCAMYYMCAFNKKEDIIWYWDEPTISLDQEDHEFHSILQKNWKDNIIPNVVLSSATLPKDYELTNFIMGFNLRFPGMKIYNVISNDYTKTIPIIDSNGYAVLPHNVFENFKEMKECVKHIEEYKTLLRHFDIEKICEFIIFIHKKKLIKSIYSYDNYFSDISSINTNSLKEYYLFALKKLSKVYDEIYEFFKNKKKKTYESCIKITTQDAHTLTDGPTIFITNNVKRISMIYLKVSNISSENLKLLFNVIRENSVFIDELDNVTKEEQERIEKLGSNFNEKDHSKVGGAEFKFQQIYEKKVKFLKEKLKKVELPPVYVPNKIEHQKKWGKLNNDAFTSDIDEETVEKIMFLNIKDEWKILLMMGIGVFCENNCVEYNEIMKKLAQQQKLYLIIASSDYIYGTNYQFCHGYLSKDLGNISQEKMIQAFGRVGRSNLQKTYTIRLRNDDLIKKLFTKQENKPEVINMNRLFIED